MSVRKEDNERGRETSRLSDSGGKKWLKICKPTSARSVTRGRRKQRGRQCVVGTRASRVSSAKYRGCFLCLAILREAPRETKSSSVVENQNRYLSPVPWINAKTWSQHVPSRDLSLSSSVQFSLTRVEQSKILYLPNIIVIDATAV